MSARVDKAYQALLGAYKHVGNNHEGNIGSPKNIGRGEPIQVYRKGKSTYVNQGRYITYFPSIKSVQRDNSILKRALIELRQNPLSPNEFIEEPYRAAHNSVFVTLDPKTKLNRPENSDDFIRTLVELISNQITSSEINQITIPENFVPEFSYLVYDGSGIAQKLNNTVDLDTLATAIKDSKFLGQPIQIDIKEIETVGVHSKDEKDPIILEENRRNLLELKEILGGTLFNTIAIRYVNPQGSSAETGKDHYELLSKLLDLRRDFKPLSFYDNQKVFVVHPVTYIK